MTLSKKKYPAYYPDNCPPDEAKPQDIKVYRICESNPASPKDILSHYQKNPSKFKDNIFAYGLSVLYDIKEIDKMRKISPVLRNYKYIATGITYEYTGVILKTPSNNCASHITWWLYEGVYPHTFFEVCMQVS